jgi:Protein of unknown function (DUF1236)
MRKSLLATIAGAALIAGGGLAAAQQRMENSQGGASGAQGSSQRELGGAAHERQPGAMQGQAQGRSGAIEEKGQSGEMQGQTQKRSGAIEEKERRSGQSGEMQGQTRKRSGAIEGKEYRSGHRGAMQGEAQGRSGATDEKEHRSGAMQGQGRSGAVQGQAQGRSGTMQNPAQGRAVPEQNTKGAGQRSVASVNLSSDQKTKLHEAIAGGNIRRVDRADFSLSIGTRIPSTVQVAGVTPAIADIVPQYRGFDYIVVRDDLVIVDPDTLDIVAVQSGAAGGPVQRFGSERNRDRVTEHRSVGSVTLSPDQRTRLHQTIIGGNVRRIDNADFSLSVGTHVPDTVAIYEVPEAIVDIVPEYRGDRYIVVGDELVIVDPDTLDVVAVIPAG